MRPENLKEFKELILRYESITLGEIEMAFYEFEKGYLDKFSKIFKRLTGFGNFDTCLLCKNILLPIKDESIPKCEKCVYGFSQTFKNFETCLCRKGINKETYEGISLSETPIELKKAYRARAKHMRTILNRLEK